MSKETTQWQGLVLEPPTFRSEVQRANTTPQHPHYLIIAQPKFFKTDEQANTVIWLFFLISFANENKTYNVTKLKKGVGRDTATAEANYSGPR